MKKEIKEKLENLFDNDAGNSNNIFDRIQDQMTSPVVDRKIEAVMDNINNISSQDDGQEEK